MGSSALKSLFTSPCGWNSFSSSPDERPVCELSTCRLGTSVLPGSWRSSAPKERSMSGGGGGGGAGGAAGAGGGRGAGRGTGGGGGAGRGRRRGGGGGGGGDGGRQK